MSDHTPRPLWRGTLRLALVSCPVALLPARHERNNLHFHMINPDTGNRVRMLTVDAETGEELQRRDLLRGYEVEKDEYVTLTEEDFDSARVESSRTLSLGKCIPRDAIDPLHYDAGYYLVPDGDENADVYAVLREALAQSGMMALSRLVLFRRERAVAVMPRGDGMVLHTLLEEGDLHAAEDAFADIPHERPDRAMVKLARQLIERQADEYDPADAEDRYEARLRQLIEAKREGQELEPEEEEAPRGNVIDLMTALKRSLGQAGGGDGGGGSRRGSAGTGSRGTTKPPPRRATASSKAAPAKSKAKPAARKTTAKSAGQPPAKQAAPKKSAATRAKPASKPAAPRRRSA
ncbi:Ku protein [Pseudoroseomonas cervicalis]|uniref:non-homologous end joining protein Ku n=1 Tax=Teichococcus cervicalis TaxID=204525 RepID=UPI00277FB176|nr:Ku protein [Pseudoroseomonas cervicalis]MDQ1078795.1 DNA end-binding protein Ku [Pseudoroseomonas cervicalis]